jgi:hypothetical protein
VRGAGEKQMTYIEVGPTTPEITEDGHNCKDSKPSEFVLKITQLHQHDDDDKIVEELEKCLFMMM